MTFANITCDVGKLHVWHLPMPHVSFANSRASVRKAMHDVKKTFFGGNLRSMLSFFIREEELSEEELINFLHELVTELTENT